MDFEEGNPFTVLDVEVGKSPRDIKRAYAKLIKQYRPESHPREFEFIRAAFEEATRATEGGYAELAYGAGAPPSLGEGVAIARIEEIREEEGTTTSRPASEALADDASLADASLSGASPDDASRDDAAPWSFGEVLDEGLARLERALVDENSEAAFAELEREDLEERVHEDEYAAEVVRSALSWLVWVDLERARRLGRRYGMLGEGGDSPWDEIGAYAAAELSDLSRSKECSEELIESISAVLSPGPIGVCDPEGTLLREENDLTRIAGYVATVDEMANLRQLWIGPYKLHLASNEYVLESLSSEELQLLSYELRRLSNDMRPPWYRPLLRALVLGLATALLGVMGFFGALVLWLFVVMAVEPGNYRVRVRPVLVNLALRHGFGNQVVVAWMHANPRDAKGLMRLDVRIAADETLDALAALQMRFGDHLHF